MIRTYDTYTELLPLHGPWRTAEKFAPPPVHVRKKLERKYKQEQEHTGTREKDRNACHPHKNNISGTPGRILLFVVVVLGEDVEGVEDAGDEPQYGEEEADPELMLQNGENQEIDYD